MHPLLRLHLQDLSDQLGRLHLLGRLDLQRLSGRLDLQRLSGRLDLQRLSGRSGLLPDRLVLLRPSGLLLRLCR